MTEVRYIDKRLPDGSSIEDFYTHLGRRIREVRTARGISQGQLAGLLGLSRPSLSLIEAGKQRVDAHTLYTLTYLFDLPFSAFLP